jgi:hypothetical protein
VGWVNNAAAFQDAWLHELPRNEMLELITRNLGLAITGCAAAVGRFLARGPDARFASSRSDGKTTGGCGGCRTPSFLGSRLRERRQSLRLTAADPSSGPIPRRAIWTPRRRCLERPASAIRERSPQQQRRTP